MQFSTGTLCSFQPVLTDDPVIKKSKAKPDQKVKVPKKKSIDELLGRSKMPEPEATEEIPKDPNFDNEEPEGTNQPNEYRKPLFQVLNTPSSRPGYYPCIELPLSETLVLQPYLGRQNARGIIEKRLEKKLTNSFRRLVQSNKSLKYSGASHDFEPDLIWRQAENELWLDIEIDEPYDRKTREPTHYIGCYDTDRDNYFTREGWVVLRFAEEQVVNQLDSVIKYITIVVDGLCQTNHSSGFAAIEDLKVVKKWTYKEALKMAANNIREAYLNTKFPRKQPKKRKTIESDPGITKPKIKGKPASPPVRARATPLSELTEKEKIGKKEVEEVIAKGHSIELTYMGNPPTLVSPKDIKMDRSRAIMVGFDHVKNQQIEFRLNNLDIISTSENSVLYSSEYDLLGQIQVNPLEWTYFKELSYNLGFAMDNELFVRLKYRKESGEISKRTLSHFSPTPEYGNPGLYIVGFCHLRNEKRTFKLSRVMGLDIINLSYANWPVLLEAVDIA